MPNNAVSPGTYVWNYQLAPNSTRGKYLFEKFPGSDPSVLRTSSGLTALPTAAQGQTDRIHTVGGGYVEYFQTTAQTLMPVSHATKGLVLDGDQVDNETQEYVPGSNSTTSPFAFTVGTDSNFFFRANLEITDASGSDQLMVGFRIVQAYQVSTSFLSTGDALYTDFAAIGFAATKANPNPISVAYDLANSGSTTVQATGATWADTLQHTLEVRVIGLNAYFLINGIQLGNPVAIDGSKGIYGAGAAITSMSTTTGPVIAFTSGTVLVPFIFVRQDADLLDAVYLHEWECGHLVDIGADKNAEDARPR